MRLAQAGSAGSSWPITTSEMTLAPSMASGSGRPKGMPSWVSTGEPKVITEAMPALRRNAATW